MNSSTFKKPLSQEEAELFAKIRLDRLPRHIAIIMDGNGRWARQRGLTRIKGHKAAIPAVQDTVTTCAELGLQALTVYAFSQENWKRPARETGTLMALLRQYLRLQQRASSTWNIRVKALGALQDLAPGIREDLRRAEAMTAEHDGLHFNLALNYSGRDDILQAARRALREGIEPETLDQKRFSELLTTAGEPDPDLVIRTSGEFRISNFLLWQIAYSEIHVTPTLWPDFRRRHLFEALVEFQARDRRFGGL